MKIFKLHMDIELVLIVLSGLVTSGLAIKAYFSGKDKDKFLEEKTNQIVELQTDLNTKSQKLITAQEELLNFTTGKGYPVIILGDFEETKCIAKIGNLGEYPIYEIESILVDVDELVESERNNTVAQNSEAIWKDLKEIQSLGPKTGKILYAIPLPVDKNEKRFNVFFTTRNSIFSQQIALRKKDKKWLCAWRLCDEKYNKIEERIAPGFLNEGEEAYHFDNKPIGEIFIGNSEK